MTFSIAPMLVLAIAIASRVFNEAVIEGQLVAQVENFIGSESVPEGPKDRGYKDAGLFGKLELVEAE